MNEELKSLLKKQRDEYKKICIKIDAGTMTVENLGYNPKLIQDEIRLIEQLLYLQEVKAEITSTMEKKQD